MHFEELCTCGNRLFSSLYSAQKSEHKGLRHFLLSCLGCHPPPPKEFSVIFLSQELWKKMSIVSNTSQEIKVLIMQNTVILLPQSELQQPGHFITTDKGVCQDPTTDWQWKLYFICLKFRMHFFMLQGLRVFLQINQVFKVFPIAFMSNLITRRDGFRAASHQGEIEML